MDTTVTTLLDDESVNGISLFLPQTSEIVWSAITIAILLIFFYKFFFPKMRDVLQQRGEKIEGEIASAATARKEADEAKEKYETLMRDSTLEASQIKDEARAQANQIMSEARIRAEKDANQIMENANRAIESGKQAAKVELQKEVTTLAVGITKKLLQSQVSDAALQQALIDADLDSIAKADPVKVEEMITA